MARHIFLSFVQEDLTLVNLFRGQSKNNNNDLEFSDFSVQDPFNSSNSIYIQKQITSLINRSSVVICLIGTVTHKSRWVDWEMEKARELGKGILGVRLHSSFQDFPPSVFNFNYEVVDWEIDQIITAIERAAQKAGY